MDNYGIEGLQNTPVAPTLSRAISQLDELNKRLSELSAQTCQLASTICGPFPVGNGAGVNNPEEVKSAMRSLNDSIAVAHNQVSGIEQAISSMARSLGG